MGEGQWTVELSREVEDWYLTLGTKDRARSDRILDMLEKQGPDLGMPHSKMLGDGLRELRFTCAGVNRRITYYLRPQQMVITLTTFRKQRQNERSEIDRARRAMERDKQRRTRDTKG